MTMAPGWSAQIDLWHNSEPMVSLWCVVAAPRGSGFVYTFLAPARGADGNVSVFLMGGQGNEGDMMGHIDDNGHISVLRRSKATQIGSVLPDGTVTDKYTTLGHITGDGAVFNKFGKKIGSCDAGVSDAHAHNNEYCCL